MSDQRTRVGAMEDLTGTVWMRKTNGHEIVVVQDHHATSGRPSRAVRVKGLSTGLHVWSTPAKLARKYHRMPEVR